MILCCDVEIIAFSNREPGSTTEKMFTRSKEIRTKVCLFPENVEDETGLGGPTRLHKKNKK